MMQFLDKEILDKLHMYFVTYGMNFVGAIIIFIIGRWLASIISKLVEKVMHRTRVDKTLISFAKNIIYAALLILVLIATLSKLGIQTASLIAVIGAGTLAVGLALQGSLANFAAGVILIIFRPFRIGDLIEVEGTKGIVEELQIFNTILYAVDKRRLVIPNSKVTSDKIINLSSINKDKSWVDMVFGISYNDDIEKAREILQKVALSDPRVLKDPPPFVGVLELADSSVNVVCRPWVKPKDYQAVRFDILEKGKIELEKNGLTIAYPQRDVHIYEEKK